MSSPLSALGVLITSGIESIESAYAKNGDSFPSLDEPSEQPQRTDAQVEETAAIVIAAAGQIIASLRSPGSYVYDTVSGVSPSYHHVTVCSN
jgi:hypothetical protein